MKIAACLALTLSIFVAPASIVPAAAQAATTKPLPNSVNRGSGKSLSSKLHESKGVIKPKRDVDPGMAIAAPVPHPNSTPVIPPSATGGGTAK